MTSNFNLSTRRFAFSAAVAFGCALSFNAVAAIDTDSIAVSASVVSSCTITADPLAFGVYDPNSVVDVEINGAVTALCTLDTAGYITLGQGLTAIGDVPGAPVRQMAGGAAAAGRLGYFLYSDPALATAWGNTGATGLNHVGTGEAVIIPVYGQIVAGQNVIAGAAGTAYADTVVATITF